MRVVHVLRRGVWTAPLVVSLRVDLEASLLLGLVVRLCFESLMSLILAGLGGCS